MGNYRLTRRGKIVLLILIILLGFLIYAVFSRLYRGDTLQAESDDAIIKEKDNITENNSSNKDSDINNTNEEAGYSSEEIDILKNKKIVLYFLPDSPELIEGEICKLKDLPIFMERIIIEGNINGYPDFNDTEFGIWLGNERAVRIKIYLIKQGFSEDKIEIINNGSKKPVNINGTPSELQKNRRVEVYYNYYK